MRLLNVWTPHTVLVRQHVGEDAGGPVFGATVTVPSVYVKDQAEVVTDMAGAETVARGTVRFNVDAPVNLGARVVVWPGEPTEYEGTVFKLSRAEHPKFPGLVTAWVK